MSLRILFTGTHGYELAPIAGKFSKNTDIFGRNVAPGNQSHTEQIPDPFGILLVVLVALDGGNPLGIGNDDIDGSRFEDIPDGDPVLAGALHTDILAIIVKEPLFESKQATVESGKALLLILGQHKAAGNDCGNEKSFVNIDATADLVG